MEDTFNVVGSADMPLKQGRLSLGLKKFTRPNEKVYFETESYQEQQLNRREDGTIIGLGYPVNTPMTKNNEPMKFLYYQGNVNGLNKRNVGVKDEVKKTKADIPKPREVSVREFNILQQEQEVKEAIAEGILQDIFKRVNLEVGNNRKSENPILPSDSVVKREYGKYEKEKKPMRQELTKRNVPIELQNMIGNMYQEMRKAQIKQHRGKVKAEKRASRQLT